MSVATSTDGEGWETRESREGAEPDRFDPLLMEEDEYLLRDYAASLWTEHGHRCA